MSVSRVESSWEGSGQQHLGYAPTGGEDKTRKGPDRAGRNGEERG